MCMGVCVRWEYNGQRGPLWGSGTEPGDRGGSQEAMWERTILGAGRGPADGITGPEASLPCSETVYLSHLPGCFAVLSHCGWGIVSCLSDAGHDPMTYFDQWNDL